MKEEMSIYYKGKTHIIPKFIVDSIIKKAKEEEREKIITHMQKWIKYHQPAYKGIHALRELQKLKGEK